MCWPADTAQYLYICTIYMGSIFKGVFKTAKGWNSNKNEGFIKCTGLARPDNRNPRSRVHFNPHPMIQCKLQSAK